MEQLGMMGGCRGTFGWGRMDGFMMKKDGDGAMPGAMMREISRHAEFAAAASPAEQPRNSAPTFRLPVRHMTKMPHPAWTSCQNSGIWEQHTKSNHTSSNREDLCFCQRQSFEQKSNGRTVLPISRADRSAPQALESPGAVRCPPGEWNQ